MHISARAETFISRNGHAAAAASAAPSQAIRPILPLCPHHHCSRIQMSRAGTLSVKATMARAAIFVNSGIVRLRHTLMAIQVDAAVEQSTRGRVRPVSGA